MGRAHHARSPNARTQQLPHIDLRQQSHAAPRLSSPQGLARLCPKLAQRSESKLQKKNNRPPFKGELKPFRYFHCGEYGDKTGRPHYHAAIFGLDWQEDREFIQTTKQGDKLYESPTLTKLWPHGHHRLGELTFESAAYTARYIMKKVTGKRAYRHYGEYVDQATGECLPYRKPEYTTMSRRPGIGSNWINTFLADVYPSDEVIINGSQCRPPKFYDQQLEKLDPTAYRKLKRKRIKQALDNESENTYTRLNTRERVQLAKIKHYTREII